MNKLQEEAIDRFQRYVMQHDVDSAARFGAAITEWIVSETSYGTMWIKAQVDYLGLPENNLLRALSRTYYLVRVGRRGALTMKIGPKSLEQFEGGSFFGINIKLK